MISLFFAIKTIFATLIIYIYIYINIIILTIMMYVNTVFCLSIVQTLMNPDKMAVYTVCQSSVSFRHNND